MSVEFLSVDDMRLLGGAADTARRMAAEKPMRTECDDGWRIVSLKLPESVTVAAKDGTVAVVAKDTVAVEEITGELTGAEEIADALIKFAASRDAEELTAAEQNILKQESALMSSRFAASTGELVRIRKILLMMAQRYESVPELADNWAEDEGVNGHAVHDLARRAVRILAKIKELREYLGEVRDAYQSAIQVKQNRLIQTFTVIAAIFMPLQLITGWYGMNLIMPEFGWRYSYPVLAGICVVLVGLLLFFFKRKRWL